MLQSPIIIDHAWSSKLHPSLRVTERKTALEQS